ncbi:expansin-A9-like [Neltuma alba]|uniref:expansin-A9-like n=1 Tax=Neltuma alba TaxID=207710 RepID=UPI0010A55335|nr:expansin-A9-like [Prosopis alba]
MAFSFTTLFASSFLFLVAVPLPCVRATFPGPWKKAQATFYEGSSTSYGGACGYDDVARQGYVDTAAVSSAMFNEGQKCGACYEIRCVDSPQWCKPGQPVVEVTATNLCPPGSDGGWCNPPKEHFDLAKSSFTKIATDFKAGVVPVEYRRVPCKKTGGIKLKITGNPYYNAVSLWNVGGAGDVVGVQVKSGNSEWKEMKREWGQKWVLHDKLVGGDLSFRVQTSDGQAVTSSSVCPRDWEFGQTYEAQNFV